MRYFKTISDGSESTVFCLVYLSGGDWGHRTVQGLAAVDHNAILFGIWLPCTTVQLQTSDKGMLTTNILKQWSLHLSISNPPTHFKIIKVANNALEKTNQRYGNTTVVIL